MFVSVYLFHVHYVFSPRLFQQPLFIALPPEQIFITVKNILLIHIIRPWEYLQPHSCLQQSLLSKCSSTATSSLNTKVPPYLRVSLIFSGASFCITIFFQLQQCMPHQVPWENLVIFTHHDFHSWGIPHRFHTFLKAKGITSHATIVGEAHRRIYTELRWKFRRSNGCSYTNIVDLWCGWEDLVA